MNRDAPRSLIAIVLIGAGSYRALFLPALLSGPSTPLLFAGVLLQVVFAIAAGIAVWRGSARAPLLILAFGASVALTGVIEIALGVVPWLYALLGALVALGLAWLLARYVAGGSPGGSRV